MTWLAFGLAALQGAAQWEPSVVVGLEGDLEARARAAAPANLEKNEDYGEAFRAARARARRVRAFLESEGRYASRITLEPAAEGRRFEITVTPGPLYRFDALTIDYAAPVDASARSVLNDFLEPLRGAAARAAPVQETRRRCVEYLWDHGYPDAAVDDLETVLDHEARTLEITFKASPGVKSAFGRVVVEGRDLLDADLLERLKPFEEGRIFARSDLALFRNRLTDLAALRTVSVEAGPPQTSAGDPAPRDVRVRIDEEPDRTVTLGGSFSTTEGPAAVAGLEVRNLLERADVTNVDLSVGVIESALVAQTTFPHAGRIDRDVRLRAGVRRQDTDAFERLAGELAVGARQPLRGHWSIEGGAALELADENDADDFEGFVGDASLPLAVTFDDRLDPLDPYEAGFLAIEARTFVNFGESRATYVRLQADARRYLPLGDHVVLAGRVRLGSLIGADVANVPPADRFFAGGGGSVRGFDFQALSPEDAEGEPFGGLSAAVVSLETRFDIWRKVSGAAFLDAGGAGAGRRPRFGAFEWAGGLGLRYDTPVGVLRGDVGFPLTSRDRHGRVEFYLGIGQAF